MLVVGWTSSRRTETLEFCPSIPPDTRHKKNHFSLRNSRVFNAVVQKVSNRSVSFLITFFKCVIITCINYSWKGISQLSFCSTSVNPKSSTLRFLYLLSMTRLRTLHDFAALPFLVLVHRCRVVLLREDREHGEKDKREGQGLFLPWKFQWIDSQKRRISSEIPVVWKLEDRSLPGKGAAGSAAMLESISCWEPAKISSCSHKIQMQSSTQQIYDADVKALIQRSDSWRKFPLTKWQVQWGLVASTLVVATLMYISYDALIYPQLSKSFGA